MDGQVIGISRTRDEIDDTISLVAPLDAKVLITGESGVGKSLLARLIHHRSGRPGPFVAINCAALPDSVLECELFGVRHSVTRGWLEYARGGTVLLDDIGALSLHLQSRLLRFLEHDDRRRVRSRVEPPRVLAATQQHLLECVTAHAFREDLYYRLNIIHLVVPPLRDRPEDIPAFVAHFMEHFSRAFHATPPRVSDEAVATLTAYPWPGNVRDLAKVIEQLVRLHRNGLISSADLPIHIAQGLAGPAPMVSCRGPRRSTM